MLVACGAVVVPLSADIDGEVFREDVDITPREFYEKMAHSAQLPKTSQPSPAAFEEAFDGGGAPVVCLTISSGLSGTYEAARLAAGLSGADVTVFDSLTASLGLGLQVLLACELAAAGRTVDEAIEQLTVFRDSMKTLILLNTLENIVKGGRLSRFQGSLSRILDIRVLLHDVKGEVAVLEKVHGRHKLLEKTLETVRGLRPDLSDRDVGITHFNNRADAEALGLALTERFHARRVIINEMGPTMATYAGEGGMILSF